MRIVFAAHENSWGGFFGMIRAALPEHEFAENIRRLANDQAPLHLKRAPA